VGGCEEKPDIVETAVSIAPAPALTAERYIATAMPLVMCECTCTGTLTALTSAEIRSVAAAGLRMPAMSLMQSVSMPIAACSLAIWTKFSTVCTGL
jgi:hypothetical protein